MFKCIIFLFVIIQLSCCADPSDVVTGVPKDTINNNNNQSPSTTVASIKSPEAEPSPEVKPEPSSEPVKEEDNKKPLSEPEPTNHDDHDHKHDHDKTKPEPNAEPEPEPSSEPEPTSEPEVTDDKKKPIKPDLTLDMDDLGGMDMHMSDITTTTKKPSYIMKITKSPMLAALTNTTHDDVMLSDQPSHNHDHQHDSPQAEPEPEPEPESSEGKKPTKYANTNKNTAIPLLFSPIVLIITYTTTRLLC